MSDEKIPAGGAGGESGGADSKQTDSVDSHEKPTPKVVSWDAHKRALDDLHKFKSSARDLEKRLGDLEAERLREKEDYKSLYETTKQKLTETEQKLTGVFKTTVETQRFNEVRAEAIKLGILDSALDDLGLIDMSDVDVEATSNGRYIVSGAKERVEKLKQERPHWFKKEGAPSVNGGGGGNPPPKNKRVTAQDVVDAERNYKRGKLTREQYTDVYTRYCKGQ